MFRKIVVAMMTIAVLFTSFSLSAYSQQDDSTAQYTVPTNKQDRIEFLFDQDPDTGLTLKANETIRLELTSEMSCIELQLFDMNANYIYYLLDGAGESIVKKSITKSDYFTLIDTMGASAFIIQAVQQDVKVCELVPHDKEYSAPFNFGTNKCDILIVLSAPGCEYIELGGLLAKYGAENGLSIKLYYLFGKDGHVAHQCLEALRYIGINNYPIFGNNSTFTAKNREYILEKLGGDKKLKRSLTETIRLYQPTIVIGPDCDDNAELIDGVLSLVLTDAVEAAADSSQYKNFPVHRVDKFYLLNDMGNTVMDWSEPLICFDQASSKQVSDRAYWLYADYRVYHNQAQMQSSFTLISTYVGIDAACNNLLENVSASKLANYRQPTPTPEPTNTPEPSATPLIATSAPIATTPIAALAVVSTTIQPNTEQSENAIQHTKDESSIIVWIPLFIGVVSGIALLLVLYSTHRQKFWAIALILPAIGAAISLIIYSNSNKATEVYTNNDSSSLIQSSPTVTLLKADAHVSTPMPTDTIAPLPLVAETAAPADTTTPTAASDPWDKYFRQSGDPQEVIVMDFEGGSWIYRNDVLSIECTRYNTEIADRGPLVYYVADIRMRDYTSYRSGIRDAIAPWKYTRYEQAVFAITGDNYIIDEKEQKGCLIRNGRLYCDYGSEDTLVIGKNMELYILRPDEFEADYLLDSGVRDTFSFGPTLIRDGVINPDIYKHRVAHPNPRCGIGMVEAGHWIAIVTDGRQLGYSMSIDLEYFAQMFQERGCTMAYNLDGGSSAAMVFMGEIINKHEGTGTSDVMRLWRDALMWGYSEQLPSPEEKTIHDGYHH